MRSAAVVFTAAAGLWLGGCGGTALQTSKPPAAISPATETVMFDCAGKAHVRPRTLVLACADAGEELTRISWRSWGSKTAVAAGDEIVNLCVPSCVAGHDAEVSVRLAATGLTLTGTSAAYRMLTITLIGRISSQAGLAHVSRYVLSQNGPQLQT
jgi:hypothetical protein